MTTRNAFYAQSGGVTAVINASACGVLQTARAHPDRIGTVFAGRNGIIGALQEELITSGGGARAAAAVEDVTWSEDEDDEKDSDAVRAALALLRSQYSLALAVAGGMRGFVEAAESL